MFHYILPSVKTDGNDGKDGNDDGHGSFFHPGRQPISVSESHLDAVRNYIHNQEEHHRHKSFSEEIDEFMKKYGWQYIKSRFFPL